MSVKSCRFIGRYNLIVRPAYCNFKETPLQRHLRQGSMYFNVTFQRALWVFLINAVPWNPWFPQFHSSFWRWNRVFQECIYVRTYMNVHICMYLGRTCTYFFMYTCFHVFMYWCIYFCLHLRIYREKYISICVWETGSVRLFWIGSLFSPL